MKIHESRNAPNPRRVRIFLAEKGIQVPYEEVDIVKRVNRDEEFRRKNPLGTVPVLDCGSIRSTQTLGSPHSSQMFPPALEPQVGQLPWT